jgi:hypothetical protein
LFVQNIDQTDNNNNHIGDACDTTVNADQLGIYISTKDIPSSAPVMVNFEAITQGKVDKVLRNFGDGSSMI